jgi:glycosyltransferase involved in cell wall biosynthesis
LAVSGALAAALTPYAPPGREIHVVPNTVDIERFRPGIRDPARSEFRVLTVCNLIPLKRVDLTIRAFAHAFGHDPCCMLEIVGHGSERRRLHALAKATKLGDRIVFSGQLSRDQVRAAMQRADLFMLTSDGETFGVVLIEALASGLPVIATRAGGPDDIVTPEVGYLVDRGDDAGLIRALEAARKRLRDEATDWSRRCADYAARSYGNAVFAAKLEPYLRSAVSPARATEH